MTGTARATDADRWKIWQLMLLSFSALFCELALIRWVPGSVRVAAYFTNLILIASFLGLGAGALLSRFERNIFRWWPLTLCALAAASLVFGSLGVHNPPGEAEFFWAGGPWHQDSERIGWLWTLDLWVWQSIARYVSGVSFYVVIALLFVPTALHFTLLGHRIGRLFSQLPPLRAYGFDLGGSVLGVLGFTVASQLSTPPVVWFIVSAAGLGVLTRWRSVGGVLRAVLVVLTLLLVLISSYRYYWSPYYKIEIAPVTEDMFPEGQGKADPALLGYRTRVNNDYHQTALNLSPKLKGYEFIRQWRVRYDMPYEDHAAGSVLVLGAGGGNDVQAALRNGATSVTAVEIDPRLARIGYEEHPERPYSDPRVRVVVDDAGSFLKGSTEHFDTIVFGFLDSHTLMSSFSTLRIDNYVYTVQSMRETVARLKPGGRVALSFASVRPFLAKRLHRMLAAALGHDPEVKRLPPYGHLFLAHRSPGWTPPDDAALAEAAHKPGKALATDSWPFLYLQEPGIPTHYAFFMVLVLLLGGLSFLIVEPGQRQLNLEFFFLGAGFLLLETRSVTEISLLFGSTWAVNAIAFATILIAVLAANTLVARVRMPKMSVLYVIVAGLLLFGYSLPPGTLFTESYVLRLVLCALVIYSPIFVAGLIVSSRFKGSEHPNLLFGSNLLGAMTGGALEYTSLVVGFQPLYLIGAALYLLAMVTASRSR